MELKGKHILIVDDEEDLCEILQYNLSNEGFYTEIAHSAEEALKKPLGDFDLDSSRCHDGSNVRL